VFRNALAFQAFNFFGLLWALAFVSGFGQVVLAGTFATYYWTSDKLHGLPQNPILSSAGRAAR